jgi:predicted dehydrogenase
MKIYLEDRKDYMDGWPVNVLTPEPTHDAVLEAIKSGPYGRCVYACDNDVVDHQVVNLEYEDGATATFTMAAFNFASGREIYVMGDKGTLRCNDDGIEHSDFLTNQKTLVPMDMGDGQMTSGHGGGDQGLMKCFIAAIRNGDPSMILSGPDASLDSHLVVFAAEKARRSGTVVELHHHGNGDPVPVNVEILAKVTKEPHLGGLEGAISTQ